MTQSHPLNRRDALKSSLLAGAGFWLGSSTSGGAERSANEKLNIACIGVGGRGGANLGGVRGENIVALCDVDEKRAGKAFERFPKTQKFQDFRRMLDRLDKQIDAVVISTPDHTHYHPAMLAMNMGKHCYCEKPMAHSVWETRQMTRVAAEKKLATQLGVQRHTLGNVRRSVELIQAGVIGKVHEVHCWIGGSRGMPKVPQEFPEIPSHLDWDLWLGPAKDRPYHPTYAPYGWRFWWDFGTGETGNWGCHILDIPFWSLGLRYPSHVSAEGPPVHPQTTPTSMTTHFQFPEQGVSLHWYHAKNGPPVLAERKLPAGGMNTLFIGSEGMLLTGFSKHKLYPEEKFEGVQLPEKSLPNSPGFYREWLDACKGGTTASCHFDYSGPLTETVLLGNVAYRAGEPFRWNAEHLKAEGSSQAQTLLKSHFREEWS